MLKGFEQQTKPLNDKEKLQARFIWKYLNKSFVAGKSITNKELSALLRNETGEKVSGARMRKIINWMHVKGHLENLIATSKGYSRATSYKELSDYAESLEGRMNAIKARLIAVQKDLRKLNKE